jgi:N-acetylmuramoyl-L-alanine amidase
VNPTIATEPGKLRMVFTREPLLPPGTNNLTFDDKLIPSATYSEANGSAEVAINSTAPLLATFSNDRRSITIVPAPQAPPGIQSAGGLQTGPAAPLPSTSLPGTVGGSSPPRLFAMIDAGHGGDERGAALTDQLAEKDINLAIARHLRVELENRGLSVALLRDSDATLTLDQRAAMVNAAHPMVYLSIHSATQGTGVRIYTALLQPADNRGIFLDWDAAQSASLPASQAAAASIGDELQRKQIGVRTLAAPLRPLNNVATAAVAIEVASPPSGAADLNSAAYQGMVTSSVASGLASVRSKLEVPR